MNYVGEIQKTKETKKGTLIQILIPDKFLESRIEKYKTKDKAYLKIKLDDSRTVTALQTRKYWATIDDISEDTGILKEQLSNIFKAVYRKRYEDIEISISNCTVTQAKQMITILTDFAIENGIPLKDLAINRTEDIDSYLYRCLVTRTCCVCGKTDHIHIHHVDKVGMGRDRTKIKHEGMKAMPLCSTHHIEMHSIGEREFEYRYKVYGITLDDYAVKKLNL